MPVKNPSSELLETIRQRGACDKTGVTAQWGYHPTQEPQIFLLQKDERLPKGWADTPAAFGNAPALSPALDKAIKDELDEGSPTIETEAK